MTRIPDPGGAMDIHPHIAGRGDQGLTGVQPHPDSNRLVLEPCVRAQLALGIYCTLNGIKCPGERDKEGVPLGIHFGAFPFLDGISQNPMVLCQGDGILVAQLIEQTGGALNVCEEKRHRARGLGRHDPAWDFCTFEQAIEERMCLRGGFDAEVILQILHTALVDAADLCHIATGIVREHQGAIGRLRDKTKRELALALLLHRRPSLRLHQLFHELFHFRFEQRLEPFTFEHGPIVIEARQQLALIERKAGGQRLNLRI